MKKLLLASAAVFVGGSAMAAPPPPPAFFSWTGCYIGAHAGAGWSRTDFSDPVGFNVAPVGERVRVDNTGFVAGSQLGCDYQFASNWVLGLAGDFSWTSLDGDTDDPFFTGKTVGIPRTVHSRTDFLGSVTGRFGYAWDRYLIYAKGGAVWSHNKYEVNNFACVIFVSCYSSATEWRAGWTFGGGFEWAVAPGWSVLLEYDHYAFSARDFTFVDPAVPTGPVVLGVKQDIDVVKVGFNYRFGAFPR